MSQSARVLLTIGELARRLGVATHRVEYVVETRGIRPIGRAGGFRIFDEGDVAFIASELRRIKEEKDHG